MDVVCDEADWNKFIANACACVNVQLYTASAWAVDSFQSASLQTIHHVTKINQTFLIFQRATLKNTGRPGTRLIL